MRGVIDRLLNGKPKSKDDAKARLKVLLIHDQIDLTPAQLEQMKAEIMEVINRYVVVVNEEAEFKLQRKGGQISLETSVPVLRVTERVPT